MKKRISFRTPFLGLLAAACLYGLYLSTLGEDDLPPLQNGDLIFQTTVNTGQSMAIALASFSPYIHTGVVRDLGDGHYSVIEAGREVTETPLSTWISRGLLGRFSLYRYEGLTPEQGGKIIAVAQSYAGRPYDFYFTFGDDAIYCSELDWRAFNEAGVPLAEPEKIGSLYINNRFVKKIIEQRWKQYPTCEGQDITFEQCYARIMEGELVTPAAIARDPRLTRIFSNYP